jgi:hypothetical protein
MPLSTILQLYQDETSYPEKITDKLYHIMLYWVQLAMSKIQTHSFSDDSHRLL